jgi:hypothetical protein
MFDEQRLGNDGMEASRPCKPDDGDNQMNEKDDDIAHPGMISKPEKTPNLAQFSNSLWTPYPPVSYPEERAPLSNRLAHAFPACSLTTVRAFLSSRNPANFE